MQYKMLGSKGSLVPRRLALIITLLLLLVACGRKTTPPGPSTIGGKVGDSAYGLLDWDEGMRILIWTDVVGGWSSGGTGSTEEEAYRQQGHVEAHDGRSFDFYIETRDGVTADFSIDGKRYDLEEGSLFLVTSSSGTIEVMQLNDDLSTLTATNEGIEAFGRNTPSIAAMIEQGAGR